jgi:hypothetical protein
VKPTATGNGGGYDWDNAFGSVADAYNAASANDQVWVAAGTYTVAITVKNGVSIYGSFAGSEDDITDRAKVAGGKPWDFVNPTIFKTTSAQVINGISGNNSMTIDGITFDGENTVAARRVINFSNGSTGANYVISNCVIKNFVSNIASGGELINLRNKTEMHHCLITNNKTTASGAIVYLDYNCWMHDCEVTNNTAAGNLLSVNYTSGSGSCYNLYVANNTAGGTGGISIHGATVYNCVVVNNTSTGGAGGISIDGRKTVSVYNNTIANNTGATTGGLAFYTNTSASVATTVRNVLLWNNKVGNDVNNLVRIKDITATVTNCLLDRIDYANITFSNCIESTDADVIFTDAASGDYTLKAGSPAVDAGTSSGITVPATDLAGNSRVIKTIDIGAYENDKYKVSVNASGVTNVAINGIAAISADLVYNSTATITFTAASAPTIVGVTVGEGGVTLANTGTAYTLTVPVTGTLNITLSTAPPVEITITGSNFTVTEPYVAAENGVYSIPQGTDFSFNIVADEGYEVTAISAGSLGAGTLDGVNMVYPVTLTNVQATTEIAVTTALKQLEITANKSDGIEWNATPDANVSYFGSYTISFTVTGDYHSPYVSVNGVKTAATEAAGVYSFTINDVRTEQSVLVTAFPANVLPVMYDTYHRTGGTSYVSGSYANDTLILARGNWTAIPLLKFVPTDAQKAAGYNKVTLKIVSKANVTKNFVIRQIPDTYVDISDIAATNAVSSALRAGTVIAADQSIAFVENMPKEIDVTDSYILGIPDEIRFSLCVTNISDETAINFRSLENGNPSYIPVLVFTKAFEIGESETKPVGDYNASLHNDVIFNGNAQLTGANNFTPANNGVVKVVKTFEVDKWYPVGFPFGIENISIKQGDIVTTGVIYNEDNGNKDPDNILNATDDNFFVKYYDGAENVFKFTDQIALNTGYIIQFPSDPFSNGSTVEVTFTSNAGPQLNSDNDDATTVYDASNYTLVANPNVSNSPNGKFTGANLFYQYNYSNHFARTSPDSFSDLKPFEAVVVYSGADGSANRVIGAGNDMTGISSQPGNDKIVRIEYYDLLGAPVETRLITSLQTGVYIVKTVYESGKTMVDKQIIKK